MRRTVKPRTQTHPHPLPAHALLTKYAISGAYTDCFVTEIARTVSHAEFVEAFYTGGLFKIERFLLRVLISKPSTDLQARQLAAGELSEFNAWRVQARLWTNYCRSSAGAPFFCHHAKLRS